MTRTTARTTARTTSRIDAVADSSLFERDPLVPSGRTNELRSLLITGAASLLTVLGGVASLLTAGFDGRPVAVQVALLACATTMICVGMIVGGRAAIEFIRGRSNLKAAAATANAENARLREDVADLSQLLEQARESGAAELAELRGDLRRSEQANAVLNRDLNTWKQRYAEATAPQPPKAAKTQ